MDFALFCPVEPSGHDFIEYPEPGEHARCIYCARAIDADLWNNSGSDRVPLLGTMIIEEPF